MKTAILVCAALVPALAWADDAKPYTLTNGRATSSSPAASAPPVATAVTQPGAFGGTSVRPTITPAAAPARSSVAPASSGGASRAMSRSRSHSTRRVRADTGGAGDQTPPPYFNKPGALIRTAGQLPQYSDAGPAGTNAGPVSAIGLDAGKAHDVGRGPGVGWGAPDKAPTPNPTLGSDASGGSGASSNGQSAPPSGGSGGASNNHGGTDNGGDSATDPGKNHGDAAAVPTGTGFDPSF